MCSKKRRNAIDGTQAFGSPFSFVFPGLEKYVFVFFLKNPTTAFREKEFETHITSYQISLSEIVQNAEILFFRLKSVAREFIVYHPPEVSMFVG